MNEHLDESWVEERAYYVPEADLSLTLDYAKQNGVNKPAGISSEQAVEMWADDDYKNYQIERRAEYMQTEEYKQKISKGNRGKKRTDEAKAAYRKAASSRPKTPCPHCGKSYAKPNMAQHEPSCRRKHNKG
ncbi:hypothetical protein phiGrn1_0065 [Vibrio phage phi-Grn1]|uniref:Uncharacterized protein n=1 Tax=Vibrio phage phi-Grn1 TaxID=1747713 RepID=A0A126HH03_9CAUD|nr:hypothetical protein phiGrn1_0065 [Vibrio phage phi-Grn1]